MPILDDRYRPARPNDIVESASFVVDNDDYRYQPYGTVSNIDVSTDVRLKMIKNVEDMFITSPLINYIINTMVNFIVGNNGLSLRSDDPKANEILHDFWSSPLNDFNKEHRHYIQELLTYGELLFVSGESGGDVALTFVPSNQLDDMTENEKYPGEVSVVKLKNGDDYKVISWNYDKQMYEGDCFLTRINRLGGHIRGYPVVSAALDWVNAFEERDYNRTVADAMIGGSYFDVTLEGLTEDEIREWIKRGNARPPKSGSVIPHNEKVAWNLVQPERQPTSVVRDSDALKEYILGTSGIALLAKSQSDKLSEGTDPVVLYMTSRQREVRTLFELIGKYVLQEKGIDGNVICDLPKIGARDLQRSSGALLRFTDSLMKAVESDWITKEEASKAYKEFLTTTSFMPRE